MSAAAAPGGVAGTEHGPEGGAGPSTKGLGHGLDRAVPRDPDPVVRAVRARRRRRAAARLLAVCVATVVVLPVLVTAGTVALGGTCWAAARWTGLCVVQVEVSGTRRVPADAVRAAASPAVDRPLVLVDGEAVAAAVRRLPGVRDATVRPGWPGILRVQVEERQVLAAVPAGPGVRLVDVDAVDLGGVSRAPAGVVLVHVDVRRAGPPALRAAVQVARDLPTGLRPLVRRVGAATPDGVWLTLADGSTVRWGSPDEAALKAAVLASLRRDAGSGGAVVYDVSAPWAPAVSAEREPG